MKRREEEEQTANLGEEDDRSGRLVDSVLIIVVKLLGSISFRLHQKLQKNDVTFSKRILVSSSERPSVTVEGERLDRQLSMYSIVHGERSL